MNNSKGVNKMGKVGQGSREKLIKAAKDTRPAIIRPTKKGTPSKAKHRVKGYL